MRSKILLGAIIFAVAVLFFGTRNVFAFSGSGDGLTADTAFQITTCTQLQEMENDLDAYYVLNNDIDCSDTVNWNEGVGFEPIGTTGTGNQFVGSFDGNNHTISGLYINRPATDIVGLFGYVSGADLNNIILEDVDIVGHGYVGALVGYNVGASISSSSASSGDITGMADYTGGLVGGNYGSISNSYFIGAVSASGDFVGGLIGYSDNGSISNSYSAGSVSASNRVGGLVGHNNNNSSISNSYSTGAVLGGWYVGGLVGLNYGPISKSYSAGSVLASINYDGGLVGNNISGSTNYSFWDIDTSGQETSVGGTGKTTAEMKTLATFTTELGENSWDFADTWAMSNVRNSGYPYLQSIPPEAATHTLTYTAGDSGSIIGDSPQTVNDEENGTAVTAVPDEGYVFVNWSDDSTDNPRTDSNVTEDITVTANFAIDEVDEKEGEDSNEVTVDNTEVTDVVSNIERAKITSWSAVKYTDSNKSCNERLKITIKGKHFDDNAKVFIGGKEASSVDVKNSKKLIAKFCLSKLIDNKTDKIRIISVKNPDTKERKASKQINLNNLSLENEKNEIADDYYNQKTQEGTRHIQEVLNKLGYLNAENITGTYGQISTEAVKKFQVDNGIESTGFVGKFTRATLEEKNK